MMIALPPFFMCYCSFAHPSCVPNCTHPIQELARTNGITVLHLDKHSLEAAHKAACCWGALGSWWSGGGSVVAAAFSLAKKLQPCIILLGE